VTVQRFTLDSSTLDSADFGLDGPSPAFILDTSTLDGVGKLDGFTFSTVATAAAQLGAATATASATVTHLATADASLGALGGAASASVTILATAASTLGSLAAAGTATVIDPNAAGSADLGGLAGTAVATVTPATPTTQQPTGRPRLYSTAPRYKPEPDKTQVPEITPTKPVRVPVSVAASGGCMLGAMSSTASGSVTFSAEDDDLQVLLVI
jgi:hypothetical protein